MIIRLTIAVTAAAFLFPVITKAYETIIQLSAVIDAATLVVGG